MDDWQAMPASSDTQQPAVYRRKNRVARMRVRSAWLFLAPMLVLLALVAGWPLIKTVWYSLTNETLAEVGGGQFIGVENYLSYSQGAFHGLLADPVWWSSVYNTFFFAVVSVSLEVLLGTAVALLLNQRFRGRTAVRALVLVPWAIPTIVSAKIWAWMLNDQFGILNDMLMHLGVIAAPLAWTADADLSMWAVILVDVWKTVPFVALLALAAMQMLPHDCYEAAEVDGIHPIKTFFRVTLPLITPALLVATVFRMLDALRVFDVIYVLTSSAKSTMTMSIYARQQLVEFQDVGYGSAASTCLFLIVALATVVFLYLGRRQMGFAR